MNLNESFPLCISQSFITDVLNVSDEASSDPESMNIVYIKQKLDHGLGRIWQDIQQKVRTYILGIDLSPFKLEQFIQFLDVVNRYGCFFFVLIFI